MFRRVESIKSSPNFQSSVSVLREQKVLTYEDMTVEHRSKTYNFSSSLAGLNGSRTRLHSSTSTGIRNSQHDALPVDLIAQLVEHYSCFTEFISLRPIHV